MQTVINIIIMYILLLEIKSIHSILQQINISLCEKPVDGSPHVFP